MKNSVLKIGDLVKYKYQDDALDAIGFKLGQLYEVLSRIPNGPYLIVKPSATTDLVEYKTYIHLTDSLGLTEHTDNFAKHVCPIVLSRGKVSNG